MYQKNLNKKFYSLFKDLGVCKNDKIMIHTNLAVVSQFGFKTKNQCSFFLKNFILEYIGEKGSVIVPTYNYDFPKGIYFNKKKSKSHVGDFSNYLIKNFYNYRTCDPVFSHIIFNKEYRKIINIKNEEAFGESSLFAYMLKKKYKIICLGCPSNSMTFLHYIEKKNNVPYRYNKIFNLNNYHYQYYVGKKKVNYLIKEKNTEKLLDNKNFIKKKIGKLDSFSVKSEYLYREVSKRLKKNYYFLIK